MLSVSINLIWLQLSYMNESFSPLVCLYFLKSGKPVSSFVACLLERETSVLTEFIISFLSQIRALDLVYRLGTRIKSDSKCLGEQKRKEKRKDSKCGLPWSAWFPCHRPWKFLSIFPHSGWICLFSSYLLCQIWCHLAVPKCRKCVPLQEIYKIHS